MLPKFELDPINTYLETLWTAPRPAITASHTTARSCSRRIRSAAARATSAAPSTEIPTSAACRAGASLMPSPKKPTTPPPSFQGEKNSMLLLRIDAAEQIDVRQSSDQRFVGEIG